MLNACVHAVCGSYAPAAAPVYNHDDDVGGGADEEEADKIPASAGFAID